MLKRTYKEILDEVKAELDLTKETIISDPEFLAYCNDSIADAEALIHKLNEDYFLTKLDTPITLVNGTQEYDLPTDIYANKIRRIIYDNGQNIYPVRRIRGKTPFEVMAVNEKYNVERSVYEYIIRNDATDGFKLVLSPTPKETGPYLYIWYLREAKRVTGDSDYIDIPQFYPYIKASLAYKCSLKEMTPKFDDIVKEFKYQRDQLINTLTEKVPDDDNEITQDLSHYNQHV